MTVKELIEELQKCDLDAHVGVLCASCDTNMVDDIVEVQMCGCKEVALST